MGEKGNGQSIKIWNTEKVTAIHTTPASPAAQGMSQLLHHSRCASFCLPWSFPRLWRSWGKISSYLKQSRAGGMAVRGFCLLQPEQMSRLALAMAALPSLLSPCLWDCQPHAGKLDQISTSSIQLLFPVAPKSCRLH